MTYKFIKQFEFEFWSNSTILDAFKIIENLDSKPLNLFSHLLSSHSMWLSRLNHKHFTCTLFQERTIEECEILMQENLEGWQQYLNSKSGADLEQSIEFMAAWEAIPSRRKMIIEDALTHIINHSSYHRGQIVSLIKGKIDALPQSTYIIYASEII